MQARIFVREKRRTVKPLVDDRRVGLRAMITNQWSCPIDLESIDIPWDDGHIPECVKERSDAVSCLRIYPEFHDDARKVVATTQDAGPSALADAIYDFTVNQIKSPSRTWGSYVLMKDARPLAAANGTEQLSARPGATNGNNATAAALDEEQHQQHLAQQAAAVFVQTCIASSNSSSGNSKERLAEQLEQAHGIAVWALAAKIGSCVPYHIDYAEWIRYRHGVTVLPILAGTWQCTRDQAGIQGGEFWVHTGGLDHYRIHGYKGSLCPIDDDDDTDADWFKIPYRFNQMIVQSGQLPHLSTKVTAMKDDWTRVIVGFNVFLHDVGPVVQDTPEHSDSFRRKVQAMRLDQRRKASISKMNPTMKRLLVMAKRKQVRDDYESSQARLDQMVQDFLLGSLNQAASLAAVLSYVDSLKSDQRWPCSDDDIMAHLIRRSKEGLWLLQDETIVILEANRPTDR
jgi:hypothetical protein